MSPAEQLHRDLDAVTQAILTGDFARLAGLTKELEGALGRNLKPLNRETLRSLQGKVDRNATLLRAAQRGLRAAQRRVAEIRGVSAGLTTYDASGQRACKAPSGTSDHRA